MSDLDIERERKVFENYWFGEACDEVQKAAGTYVAERDRLAFRVWLAAKRDAAKSAVPAQEGRWPQK